MARVSAILVNYFSADLIARAVRSLRDQEVESEILVLDNSLDSHEAEHLGRVLPESVKLRVNTSNTGFGGACNQAYAEASGELILLLNPDAYLLPGALRALAQALQASERVAAVGPKTFWDAEQQFLMPPSTFPSLVDYCESCLARNSLFFSRWRSRRFRHWACRYWGCEAPLSVPALSGGHVLLKRSALEKVGGLFDERFFLYWEDSDLMQRLRAAGYDLRMVPAARAVHEYTHSPEKSRRIGEGWPTYYQKHLGAHPLVRWLDRKPEVQPKRLLPTRSALSVVRQDNGDLIMAVPSSWRGSWLLEISVNEDFVPAIGHRGKGSTVLLVEQLQARLAGQMLYLRLSAPGCSGHSQYWQSGP
ncbi:glycosyltransferase family 2 protein [Ferrovum myxofaciens]|uniref:glycosyltransferase family 2 protein n=1 Tax=Ferrovum myxofaciens TaxID=416213 RepID=UPI002353877D|nr:glycosyltransferase family 2 protein [Ferrovum myxofaciens]MBU6994209.1 glycosyltransferase family 2 protein [Ferrovum myxofaciens]